MPESTNSDLIGIAKVADSKLAKGIYKDGLKPATVESGMLLGELAKTARFAVQPLLTAIQGSSHRINSWISEALRSVPTDRLVAAKPPLLSATVAAISVEDDSSEMRKYYVKLLASLMDGDRQIAIHPAFPKMLQELSPTDALLLQITPSGKEIVFPKEISSPDYHVSSGLIWTLENYDEGGEGYQRQRFFVEIEKCIDESSFEYVGLLEILPATVHILDGTMNWSNLVRLGLVKHNESTLDFQRSAKKHLPVQRMVDIQLAKLLMAPPANSNIYRITYRTEVGRQFAECCIPEYSGSIRWHPFLGDSPSRKRNVFQAGKAIVRFET